ncbi:ABC transporter related, partial [Microbacterium sp. HM58-2]
MTDTVAVPQPLADEADDGAGAPLVELRDVTRSFPGPPEVQALKGATLTVAPG